MDVIPVAESITFAVMCWSAVVALDVLALTETIRFLVVPYTWAAETECRVQLSRNGITGERAHPIATIIAHYRARAPNARLSSPKSLDF